MGLEPTNRAIPWSNQQVTDFAFGSHLVVFGDAGVVVTAGVLALYPLSYGPKPGGNRTRVSPLAEVNRLVVRLASLKSLCS